MLFGYKSLLGYSVELGNIGAGVTNLLVLPKTIVIVVPPILGYKLLLGYNVFLGYIPCTLLAFVSNLIISIFSASSSNNSFVPETSFSKS